MNKLLLALLIGLLLTGCNSSVADSPSIEKENQAREDMKIQKSISLDNNFKIETGRGENFDKFETFTLFRLSRGGKELFLDTSLTEYEFGDSRYPMLRGRNDGISEILVEVNDRPNKNYLKLFRIQDDKVISVTDLPTFDTGPLNLDEDENTEFICSKDFGEVWDDNGEKTSYNPILVYEDSPDGFKLDTALTIKKNAEKYGKFYGYKYDEKVVFNVKDLKTEKPDEPAPPTEAVEN